MASSTQVEQQFNLKVCVAKKTRKCCPNQKRQSDIKDVPAFRGNFSKAFPHIQQANGSYVVDPVEYKKLIKAVYKWDPKAMLEIKLGTPNPPNLKYASASTIFDLELIGKYAGCFKLPLYPSITSAEAAGEMVELYEMALLRDFPFIWYEDPAHNAPVLQACANLNLLSDFRGPKINGQVTPATLFRSLIPNTLNGPFVSQFLLRNVTMGALTFQQQYPSPPAGLNYITSVNDFLTLWNGRVPSPQQAPGPARYIYNLRQGTEFHHYDEPTQLFYDALRILTSMGAPLSPGNPYFNTLIPNQTAFVDLGIVDVMDLMSRACKLAMDACWFIKWTQLRLRPEEFGYQTQLAKNGDNAAGISAELLNNPVLAQIFAQYNTYLLPQAFAEAAPVHPAYPQGHSSAAGAQCFILKAWYNCNTLFSGNFAPVQANSDGTALVPVVPDPMLTVGSQLDLLAWNCGTFRNAAGIHYRSDIKGLELGEAVGIEMLKEHVKRYHVKVVFTITRFDGSTITIEN